MNMNFEFVRRLALPAEIKDMCPLSSKAEEIVEEKEEEVGEVEEVEDYYEEEVEDEEEEEVDEEDEEEKATKERLRNMGDYFFGDGK